MENKIRKLLDENKAIVSTRLWSVQPIKAEAAVFFGHFDYLEFLAEYSAFTFENLENFVRACELHDCGSMIKIDLQNRFYVAQKALAVGFQAILFADHHNADEVRETIRLVTPETPKYGGGFGYPDNRWLGFGGFPNQLDHAEINASAVFAFMIEKKEAVENIEEICSVPGVDIVQFGPSDYCMSRGWNIADHREEVEAVERHVIEVALKHGVRPRCEINTLAEMEKYSALGVRDFVMGDEMEILQSYWSTVGAKAKEFAENLEKSFSV